MTQIKLTKAVRDTDKATSPLASDVNILDVAPPGAAAISITPTANSGFDKGNIRIIIKATTGKTIIWDPKPIKKSRGCLNILLKSFIVKPKPNENIIKAIAKGRKISDIYPISYNNIRFLLLYKNLIMNISNYN